MEDWYSKRFERAKTAVFWDLQDCRIPKGLKAVEVSKNIRSALVKLNYLGTVFIYAYGDKNQFLDDLEPTAYVVNHKPSGDTKLDHEMMKYRRTASIQVDDSPVGRKSIAIVFNHTPAGDKDARLQMILVDMFIWKSKDRSPANCVLILRDISRYEVFPMTFYRMQTYNLLFSQPENVPTPGELSEDTILLWESLCCGHIDWVKRDTLPCPTLFTTQDRTLPQDRTHSLDNSRVGSGRSPTGFLLAGVGALVCILFGWVNRRSR